jgi:LuxR family transcriptional regulator, maltose regulon positive regulatory protein
MSGRSNPAASARKRARGKPPARRARSSAKAGASFEVLQSKLAIPSLRPGLIPRTGLVNRLKSASDARVFSIAAPAGYGKTTLLAQWAHDDPRPFAWVSLEQRDDDPVALLTYIAAALDRIHPVDRAVFRGAAAASDSLWSTALPRLGAALAAMPEPIVLVLDDVHELRHRDCVDALEPLAKHLTGGSQLVLSGRADDGMPLARIRADRRLLEVGIVDLALTDEEAHSLLSSVGAKVTKNDASELNVRAEGWVAGLHLAALFIQQEGEDAATSFAGDDKFVADYLRSEHLSHLRRGELGFLTRTSVLDRMSAQLCDEVLERSDSAKRLHALADGNFFVVPLDHHREWFRYHHLFRDLLRAELERAEPELGERLNRRAAAWCEAHDLPDAAIEYAAAADAVDEVARLVSTHALPFFRSGRVATVERWLAWFDDLDVLLRYPAVSAFAAWVSALRGRSGDAERYAYALEHTSYTGPMPDGTASPEPWAAVVRAMLCKRGVERMRADAELALAGLSDASFWRSPALLLSAVGLLFNDEPDAATALLERTVVESYGSGAVYAGVVSCAELALLALERDDLEGAESHLARGQEFLEHQPIDEYVPAALHLAAGARLALAQGRAASARELLLSAMRTRAYFSRAIPWFAVQTRLELARAHIGIADVEGARILVREAEDTIQHRPELGTLVEQARELREQLANVASIDIGWASTLTAAELRVLPLLTTHLSFREIAERLFVSRNTVKSQAISIYRKLDASSRSEAIDRAIELGLVDSPTSATASGFTPTG